MSNIFCFKISRKLCTTTKKIYFSLSKTNEKKHHHQQQAAIIRFWLSAQVKMHHLVCYPDFQSVSPARRRGKKTTSINYVWFAFKHSDLLTKGFTLWHFNEEERERKKAYLRFRVIMYSNDGICIEYMENSTTYNALLWSFSPSSIKNWKTRTGEWVEWRENGFPLNHLLEFVFVIFQSVCVWGVRQKHTPPLKHQFIFYAFAFFSSSFCLICPFIVVASHISFFFSFNAQADVMPKHTHHFNELWCVSLTQFRLMRMSW